MTYAALRRGRLAAGLCKSIDRLKCYMNNILTNKYQLLNILAFNYLMSSIWCVLQAARATRQDVIPSPARHQPVTS